MAVVPVVLLAPDDDFMTVSVTIRLAVSLLGVGAGLVIAFVVAVGVPLVAIFWG